MGSFDSPVCRWRTCVSEYLKAGRRRARVGIPRIETCLAASVLSKAALFIVFCLASAAQAATVTNVVFTNGNYSGCTTPATVASYQTTDPFVRIWFTVSNANAGDIADVQWLNPSGGIFATSTFQALSGGGSWCFGTIMNVSGTAAANMPGAWTARIVWNSSELARRSFQILSGGGSSGAAPQATGVDRPYYMPGSFTVVVFGSAFQNGARAHIDYTQAPNGHRLTIGGPVATNFISERQLAVPLSIPDAGPYAITIVNPNGTAAAAVPFFLGPAGFNLPFAAGETWKLSQGNNDTPDHNLKNAFAYDFTDGPGHCLVAMKSGLAYPFDNGAGQGSGYGNWVTIDHGGGEYSHYAHMLTGRFAFTQPTYVQQGQALGMVGNSGYSLPTGGGYHVHAKVTGASNSQMNNRIYDQAVPFAFAPNYDATMVGPVPGEKVSSDNPNDWPSYTSSNYSLLGSCPSSSNPTQAKLNITFSPNPVGTGFAQGCPLNNYYFTLTGAEVNGIGISFATLSVDSWTWNVPALGVPGRIDGKGTFQTGLSWCRSPGSSVFNISGTDDRGNHGTWSGTVIFK